MTTADNRRWNDRLPLTKRLHNASWRIAYWLEDNAKPIVCFCAMAVFWMFAGYVVAVTFGGFR